MQSVKKHPELLSGRPTDVAARALNVGRSTINRIKKTGTTTPKKRTGRPPKFDEFDTVSIQNIIKEFYRNK
jgi:transposase